MVKDFTDCGDVREEFSALLDGELSLEERDAVERHLGACAECLRELHQLQRVDRLYAELPRVTAPVGFEERVRATVTPKRRWVPVPRLSRPTWRLPAKIPAPVFALAALCLVTISVSLTFLRYTLDREAGNSMAEMAVARTEATEDLTQWEPGADAVEKSRDYARSIPMEGQPLALLRQTPPEAATPSESAPMASENVEQSIATFSGDAPAGDDRASSEERGVFRDKRNRPADEIAQLGLSLQPVEADSLPSNAQERDSASQAPPVAMKLSEPAAPALPEVKMENRSLAERAEAESASGAVAKDAGRERIGSRGAGAGAAVPPVQFYTYRDEELVRIKPMNVKRTQVVRKTPEFDALAKKDPAVLMYAVLSTTTKSRIAFQVGEDWYEIAPEPSADE